MFTSPVPLWLQVLAVGLWVGGITLLSEELSRRKLLQPEQVRKVVHIGTGNVILLAWWLQIPTSLIVAASVLFSLVALLSYRFPILPGINSVGRQSFGTFFYAVSIGVLAAWFWQDLPHFTVLGILVMTWGDGLAALVGQQWGQHRYQLAGIPKSWEGSGAMALVSGVMSALILFGVYGATWQVAAIALVAAIAAAVLEAFSKYGVDNLTVPLGSAGIAYWLSQML